MRRGVRGFPCRVTPSHFGLDSRGRYDRLAVPGLLFFKPSWCSKNIMLPGSCCQVRNCVGASFILWFCVIALQGYFDSSVSFFLLPFEGVGVTLICPCSEWFQTFLVKVNDELVWELGQTCAAARNGTIIIYNLIIMVGKIQNPPIPMGGFCFIFEHINIFFYREILWNIIIAKKISIIIFIR